MPLGEGWAYHKIGSALLTDPLPTDLQSTPAIGT